jgi:4-hydroxy-3-methylbut-2-enyl diphosphate reductase
MGSTVQVVLASCAGFCFGVRRAVERVEALVGGRGEGGGRIVTLGPLIHNPQELERLERLGVRTVNAPEEVQENDRVVVRSHGIPLQQLERIPAACGAVEDATCPYVRACQSRARRVIEAGYSLVLVADAGHPETESILSHAHSAAERAEPRPRIGVVSGVEEEDLAALELELGGAAKVAVVAQTTLRLEQLTAVAAACVERFAEVRVFNTICEATRERQREACAIAGEVDRMVVVGGRNSANTRRLVELCASVQPRTVHVETSAEIEEEWLRGARRIGVTAGASTPDRVIQEVVRRLEG